MTDDAFYLTPHDIRAQEFARVFRGYDPAEVDSFRDRVSEELERLLRERVQHEERLRNTQEQLRAFRERERALNEALVAAQQLRNDSRQQAERDADSVLREARVQADLLVREAKAEGYRIVEGARFEERDVRASAEAAARQFSAYLAGFRGLLERQLAELEVLQAHARTIVQVQADVLDGAKAP